MKNTTRHVPTKSIRELDDISFSSALLNSSKESDEYDVKKWLFVPNIYTEYRYILGTRGNKPLICVGVNPSTASPVKLDPTVKSVERIAIGNGFDSFLMMNACAQRATSPDDMDKSFSQELHSENMKAFRYVLETIENPCIWAAWGTIITKRDYLPCCLSDIAEIVREYKAIWVCAGNCSKAGHPHHPLYLRKDEPLRPFNMDEYTIYWPD